MDLSNQIFDGNKTHVKRTKRWGIFLVIVASIALFVIVGYIQRETTAKKLGLISVYDALHYYEDDVYDNDIVTVVYGKDTALIISAIPTEYKLIYFYHSDESWTYTGAKSWSTSIDDGSVILDRTNKGHEWYVTVLVDVKQGGNKADNITDGYDTSFNQFGSDSMIRWYIAYFNPTSSDYEICINGKTYNIELNGVD